MQKLITSLLLYSFCALLSAAPLFDVPIRVQQPDGSLHDVFASGDEYYNWLHDKDNFTILLDDDGWYVYAQKHGDEILPGNKRLGSCSPAGIPPGLNFSTTTLADRYRSKQSLFRHSERSKAPGTGQINNLVIFIKFVDDTDFELPFDQLEALFNASGEGTDSLKQYFWDTSYHELEIHSHFFPIPQSQQILSYTDSYPREYFEPYSVSNPAGYTDDMLERGTALIQRALFALAAQIPPHLDFDSDNDGYIDNICVVVRGSIGAWSDFLWPHHSCMNQDEPLINGAQPCDYNLHMETHLANPSQDVFALAHEMFHSMGAPDLYRYENMNIRPVGPWDLMADSPNPPCQPGAWMKYQYGSWVNPPILIFQSGSYSLLPLASGSTNIAYRINSWQTGEIFLLEYRKPVGYIDANIPGTGLLVYRINLNACGNSSGPPDEVYIYRPGSNNNNVNGNLNNAALSAQNGFTTICETSVPSGFTSTNLPGGLNLYDVGIAGDSISFKVKISNVQMTSPMGGEEWISGTDQTIRWLSRHTGGEVKIEFSPDLGETWSTITESTANNGNFLWEDIPLLDSEDCLIKVSLNGSYHADSNNYPFRIATSLMAPEPIYPPQAAQDIPTDPLMRWNHASGSEAYHLQIATDPEFQNLFLNAEYLCMTSYQVNGLSPYNTYYWRVSSRTGDINSAFCPTQSFVTGALSELPQVPALLNPPPYATGTSITPLLSWQESALADSYHVQVALDGYFSNIVAEAMVETGSWRSQPLQTDTIHYWRVAAHNEVGSSNYTTSRMFTTGDGLAGQDDVQSPAFTAIRSISPNPFCDDTTINIGVKELQEQIKVDIFNIKGQHIRSLYSGMPDKHELELNWDTKDESGAFVSRGIYLCRLKSKNKVQMRKIVFLRQ